MNIEIVFAACLAAFALAAFGLAGYAIRAVHRQGARHASMEASLIVVRRELDLATTLLNRIGRRLKAAESECVSLKEHLEQVAGRGEVRAFDQAIDFARRGAASAQLSLQCGLSRAEADLVAQLHGRRRAG